MPRGVVKEEVKIYRDIARKLLEAWDTIETNETFLRPGLLEHCYDKPEEEYAVVGELKNHLLKIRGIANTMATFAAGENIFAKPDKKSKQQTK